MKTEEIFCDICYDKGEVEKERYISDDSTGYYTIVEGTGKFIKCPKCGDFEE